MNQELQNSLIETIKIVAGERLKNVNFTKSYTGLVKEMYDNVAVVEIFESDYECMIPHNLSSYIEKNDIVIVQDISNNRFKKIVLGVISSLNKDMFHIYDTTTDTIVSSVLQLWDEDLQKEINIVFEIE